MLVIRGRSAAQPRRIYNWKVIGMCAMARMMAGQQCVSVPDRSVKFVARGNAMKDVRQSWLAP